VLAVVAGLALAACLLALVVRVEPSQAAFPGQNGKIAFQSGRDGNLEIYTMNPDGSSVIRLTNNPTTGAVDRFPAWSPDGNKIAFTRWNLDFSSLNIYVMNADGSNQTNISNGDEPAWSPDGTKIAFISGLAGPGIYVMNSDGSNPTNIAPNLAFNDNNEQPDWQPITASTNTAPTITNMRPAPGSTTTDRTPTIAATVKDQQTNLAKSNITLFLDGATIPRTAYSYNQSTDRMSYTPQKNLMLGNHTVKVVARDASGLSTPKSWSFKIVHP
jgi:dipeptidyl aminopeptidase/acylaminoacyl peptidase